jgi:hypothetical protein
VGDVLDSGAESAPSLHALGKVSLDDGCPSRVGLGLSQSSHGLSISNPRSMSKEDKKIVHPRATLAPGRPLGSRSIKRPAKVFDDVGGVFEADG